jgi:Tol biopolymer transport system component
MKAELFAPGMISTNLNEHSSLAFSPNGTVVLWAVMDSNYRGRLFEMKYANGVWSKPASPSFADATSDDYCPSFSTDGRKLVFSSRRRAVGYPEGRGNRIWSVERMADGWGTSVPFDTTVSKAQEFSHSIAKNGTLYFSSALDGAKNLDICIAEKTNAGYAKPDLLPYSINTEGYEYGPYIAPDEDFLIFESTRPEGIDGSHDLYISFKNKKQHWGMPVNMGPKINSGSMERFPRLSPDGKYLFFGSNRDQSAGKKGFDIYWIDAKVIDELRNAATAKKKIE